MVQSANLELIMGIPKFFIMNFELIYVGAKIEAPRNSNFAREILTSLQSSENWTYAARARVHY
jgi:hypothetical protein